MNEFLSWQRNGVILLALLIVGWGSSCNRTKGLSRVEEKKELSGESLLRTLAENQLQADWLEGKCNLKFDNGDMAVGASATIKMIRDSVIWMNVKKLGFELARTMITQDSIYVIDRFNKEYWVEPLSFIEQEYRLPANLMMLQQILLGNPVYMTTANLKSDLANDQYRLSASEGDQRNDYWFAMPNYQLEQMKVEDTAANRLLQIQLQDYKEAGANRDFSYLRLIEVNSRETGRANIEIEFSQVELNVPFDIRFSVPSRYERVGK